MSAVMGQAQKEKKDDGRDFQVVTKNKSKKKNKKISLVKEGATKEEKEEATEEEQEVCQKVNF